MRSAVLDASVVVKLVAVEPGSARARELFEEPGTRVIADWTMVEVAHALWKRHVHGQAPAIAVAAAFEALEALDFAVRSAEELLREALALALEHRHPVYDCLYVALARDEGAPLVTADAALRNVAEAAGIEVLWVESR